MVTKDKAVKGEMPVLMEDEDGLYLSSGEMKLRADFTSMIPRLRDANLRNELIVRAAHIKGREVRTAIDATGGLGEDALLLAASGLSVRIYERNEIIYRLLEDAIRRGKEIDELREAASRMTPVFGDSIEAFRASGDLERGVGLGAGEDVGEDVGLGAGLDRPDIILLDPMFPEKGKSGLTRKKLQLFQMIVPPCDDEEKLLEAAIDLAPHRIIIKRPLKGPFLGGIKPNFSYSGKTVRIDCITLI